MTLSAALKARLLAGATIAAITQGRVGRGKQLQAVPAITLQIIADPRPQHFKGFQRVRPTSVQIDVWAADEATAEVLREHVIAVLVPADASTDVRFQRAMITNIRSGAESQQAAPGQRIRAELHRESIDFIFTHNGT